MVSFLKMYIYVYFSHIYYKHLFTNDGSLFILAGYALDPSDDTAHIEEK
jgi:hypothetical protein